MSQSITIKTIANDLGISHMTVSRALRGQANVKPETLKAILDHAAGMGYVPNAAAITMRGMATPVVGLLLPNLANDFYAAFANRFVLACDALGLVVIIQVTTDEPRLEALALRRLREQGVKKIVMVPTPSSVEFSRPFLRGAKILQLIRHESLPVPSQRLLSYEDEAFDAAVKDLRAAGHSHIGYIGGDTSISTGRARRLAVETALTRNGLRAHSEYFINGRPNHATGAEGVDYLLALKVPPSAIICGGLEISSGALQTLLENDIAMPDQIAFVGYGDLSHFRWLSKGISTIAVPTDALAVMAAGLIGEDKRADLGEKAVTATYIKRATT